MDSFYSRALADRVLQNGSHGNIICDCLTEVRQIITSPRQFFEGLELTSIRQPLTFLAVTSIVPAVFSGIHATSAWEALLEWGLTILLMSLGALILHATMKCVGGKGTLLSTFAVAAYTEGAIGLFAFLPLIGWLASLYGLVIAERGLEHFHKLGWIRLSLAVPLGVFFVICVVGVGGYIYWHSFKGAF